MDALGTLQVLAHGELLEELCAAMIDVAEDVLNTGRGGSVTLTLKLSQATRGEPSVIVSEEIKRTPPKKDPRGAILFVGDGEFHRHDPRQQQLEFRVLEEDASQNVRRPPDDTHSVREAT
jgi:hypothetical protein